jgi:hypothetical protein
VIAGRGRDSDPLPCSRFWRVSEGGMYNGLAPSPPRSAVLHFDYLVSREGERAHPLFCGGLLSLVSLCYYLRC